MKLYVKRDSIPLRNDSREERLYKMRLEQQI